MNGRANLALTLGLLLVATATPAADNPYRLKPGAEGQNCLSCHEDFKETLALPHVHSPVKAGDCADCHDPHTSDHGALLASEPAEVCAECHSDIVPDAPRSAHPAVMQGECVTCHDPHAAENPKNLRGAGNQLCYQCHEDVAKTTRAASFGHGPAKDDCLACHDPHASADHDHLLINADPELCTTCHDPTDRFFTERHEGYPVSEGRCTSCHSPHGSNNAGLLWASVHDPVARGMCKQCHQEAGSENALSVKRPGFELCRACHNDMLNQTFAAQRLHWPVVSETSCLSCHRPHASSESKLLAARPVELCGDCHRDTMARQAKSVTPHPPVTEGECASCHDVHASDNVFLLQQRDLGELCGNCHEWQGHSSHPIGREVKDQRNPNLTLDCASCHDAHGSPHKSFTHEDYRSDLCVQCHQELRR